MIKVKPLLICHSLILLFAITFFFPLTRPFWDVIDAAVFRFLNGSLEGRPHLQVFWAFLNHRMADFLEDFVFLGFFIAALLKAPVGEKVKRVAQFIFCILITAAVIYFINTLLFRETLRIPRKSPSLVLTPCIRLSDLVTWIKVKDRASVSFPGDHATTLIFFAATYTFFAGKRLGKYAIAYAIFRCLPRMVTGAHWFTDIALGSSSIALLILSWALCTPFQGWVTGGIEKFLLFFRFAKKGKNEEIKDLRPHADS